MKQLLPFSSIDDLRASVEIFNEPSAESLGRAVLSLLMFAESLICIFWIFTLSSLGEAYAFMAAVPYVYIIFSYISLLVFYRLKQFDYIIFTQLIMLLVMPFFYAVAHWWLCCIQWGSYLGTTFTCGCADDIRGSSIEPLVYAVHGFGYRFVAAQ